MNAPQRYSLTHKRSLYLRQYVLGIVFSILGAILIWKAGIFFKLFGILCLAVAAFYFSLRSVEFDVNFIYIGKQKFTFAQLEKMGTIELNYYIFPYLIINNNGKKRRYITDIGKAGLLRILLGIFFPSLDPYKDLARFMELYKESRIK